MAIDESNTPGISPQPRKRRKRNRAAYNRAYWQKNKQTLGPKNKAYQAEHDEEIKTKKREKRLENVEAEREKDRQRYPHRKDQQCAQARMRYWKNHDRILEQAKKYYQENKKEILEYGKEWHLLHRDANIDKMRLYRAENKDQLNFNKRIKYAKDPEPGREQNRRRRARIRGVDADLTVEEWRIIKELYGHRCVYCRRKMKRLTMDHIIPLSKGGAHTASNVVPACQSCNSKKGDRAPLIPVQPMLEGLKLVPVQKKDMR